MVYFFTKLGKMQDLGFGTSNKVGLCPKLQKNPAKPKLAPQNVLYYTSCPFLRSSKSIEICHFWLKSAPKSHFIQSGSIISWQYIFLKQKSTKICNVRSRNDQKLTSAKNYEHPFIQNENLISSINQKSDQATFIIQRARTNFYFDYFPIQVLLILVMKKV